METSPRAPASTRTSSATTTPPGTPAAVSWTRSRRSTTAPSWRRSPVPGTRVTLDRSSSPPGTLWKASGRPWSSATYEGGGFCGYREAYRGSAIGHTGDVLLEGWTMRCSALSSLVVALGLLNHAGALQAAWFVRGD